MDTVNYDTADEKPALEALFEAQKIAFAPMVFQGSLALRDLGILELLAKTEEQGAK